MFNYNHYFSSIELVLFVAFALFFAIQIYYYLRIYFPVLLYKNTNHPENLPVSVVICAKNEADNLRKNLPFILEQNHPKYEVIVVNDASTDDTAEVIGELLARYKHLKTTSLPGMVDPKFTHGKKLAITVGIKAAQYDWVVFTDADCWPVSPNWLTTLQKGCKEKEIVLGYGGYEYQKGLLNNYIRYDTLNNALMYLGYALIKKPYMGVGRNLAYMRELFFRNKGFANHYGILSGDDDLFISETSTSTNTAVVIDHDAITLSKANTSWSGFYKQKIRHLSTASAYKAVNLFRIGMEPVSRAWYYLLLPLNLLSDTFFIATLAMVSFRLAVQITIYLKAQRKFGERNIFLSFIIFDIASLLINFLAYFALTIRRRHQTWK